MANPNCDLSFIRNLRNEVNTTVFVPERRQELLNHIDDLMRWANALGAKTNTRTLSGTAQEVQERITQQLAVSQAAYLSPKLHRNFAHYLAYLFDVKRQVVGLSDNFTQPGAVRELLQTFRKRGFGEIREMVASLNLQDLAISADQTFRQVQRKYNIPQKPFEIFKLNMAEAPHHPYLQDAFNLRSPAGVEFLAQRQRNIRNMADQFGISAQDMNAMAEVSQRLTDTYQEIRQAIDVLGIQMGDANVAEVQRYIPRQFSQEAVNRIYTSKAEDARGVFRNMFDDTPKTVREMFVQSRQTNHFIPEDEVLVDFALRNADPNIYNLLSKATGQEINGIADVIADNGLFVKAFVDYFDRNRKTAHLFDQMVDAGLIAKIPMSSSELYDYVMTRYTLPFNTPKEMINVSFETQVQIYRKQLEELAGRAMAANFVARSAVDGEWGVTRAVVDADPEFYRGFRPLVGISRTEHGDITSRVGAIPGDFALRFGLTGPQYENVLVHPIVADNIQAMLEISTSPAKLGEVARTWERLNGVFKSQALASSGFVARQLFNNIFQTVAAGGALNIYVQDVMRVSAKVADLGNSGRSIDNLEEAFDNTRRLYDGMTERELWHRLRKDGFLEEIMPLASANFNNLNYQPDFGPSRAIDNQFRYSRDLWTRVDSTSDALKAMRQQAGQSTRAVDNLSSRFFYRFQQMGSLFDQVSRLSTMKSLMSSPVTRNGLPRMSFSDAARAAYEGPISRGAVGNFQRSYNYQRALEHAQRYFFSYSDLGEADKILNRYVVPFWSFTSRNTFSVFKKLVREPHTFVAYQRIYAALNEPAAEEGADWPDAGEPDWLSETQPLRYVTEDGDYFAIPMTPIDPLQEGLRGISGIGDTFLESIGIEFGQESPEQELQRLLNKSTNRGLDNIVSNTYPWLKSAYGAISGANPDTHRRFKSSADIGVDESFLGFRTTPFMKWLFETNIPLLNRINNQNPFGVFGRPDRFDRQGNLIEEGTPAWLTGAPRSRSEVVRDYQDWRRRVASYAGITITPVDTAFGMGYNETGLSIAMSNAKKDINKQRGYIRTLPTSTPQQLEKFQQEREELFKMLEFYTMLRMDLAEVTAWAEERDLPLQRALRQIKQRNLEMRQIESLSEQERYDIIEEMYGNLEEQ